MVSPKGPKPQMPQQGSRVLLLSLSPPPRLRHPSKALQAVRIMFSSL